ncbi:MAG: M56 and DUF3738 domain-containing protein [Bryobacteraceae bacterium]
MMAESWTTAIANHLWQSTLVAGVAALLALALKDTHARVRHWLWLSASVKFLIPFSVLAALGRNFGWLTTQRVTQPELSFVMDQISQPFQQGHTIPLGTTPPMVAQGEGWLPALLLAIWACGLLAVTLGWARQWFRIRSAIRAASPAGLELEIPVLASSDSLEPGVFGIFRPVMLLPQGILDHLNGDHLASIVAHELCHVRRRDNLAAAVHMAVEAVFWFHPLVWWVGARLVEEREHACDEEVLRLGNKPEVYAEGILKTCQFYMESPLACVSGIAGSDLKKRIVRIMTPQIAAELGTARKFLLAAAGVAAFAGPILFGLLNAPPTQAQSTASPTAVPAFDVVSIKPSKGADNRVMIGIDPSGRFNAENITLKMLLEEAYGIKDSQLLGAPGWAASEHYNIEAKPEESLAAAQRKLGPEQHRAQLQQMLQAMLTDRFQLKVHHESKQLPLYELVIANGGPKIQQSPQTPDEQGPPGPMRPDGPPPRHSIRMMGRGHLTINGVDLNMFSDVLSRQLGRVVVNQTGLKGNYDFELKWTPDINEGGMFAGGKAPGDSRISSDMAPPPDAAGPTIFTALQEQLGLKLESKKGPVDTVVIDSVERPSEN